MKRGPKPEGPERYTATMPREPLPISWDVRNLIERRTEPYLTTQLPLKTILAECYLQGMRDALQAIKP